MLLQILSLTVFVSVNCMIVPSPCQQRPMPVVVPAAPPPCTSCANKFSVMSLPFNVPTPCNCNPPVTYLEPVNYGCGRCGSIAEVAVPEILPVGLAPRCGPIAEIAVPKVMPVSVAPARCGRISEIAVPEVLPYGIAPARCGRIAEIAVPELMPVNMSPVRCGRVAEIAVPEYLPYGMPPARCGRIDGVIVPQVMPIGIPSPRCGPIAEIAVPEIFTYGMGNPFLPAASPVSALAPPFYPFTPPICPCECKCQYLKKIPIPPPCI